MFDDPYSIAVNNNLVNRYDDNLSFLSVSLRLKLNRKNILYKFCTCVSIGRLSNIDLDSARAKIIYEWLHLVEKQIRFEITALLYMRIQWVKKRGNFKINLFFDQMVSFLYCLCYALCSIWPHIGSLFFLWIRPKSEYGIWIYTINKTICHIQIWVLSTRILATGH